MVFFLIFGKNPILFLFIKKGNKQIIDYYRPVSLLPICGKMFKKLLFNLIFKFLDNNLLCSNQSDSRPSDSCEYQILSIVHGIHASFDCCPSLEVTGVFLDISKAFDQVWHEGLVYKLPNSLQMILLFFQLFMISIYHHCN